MYERVEKLLKEKGITAYRLCKDIGVSTSTITHWKKGAYTPKQDTLKKIADYFNVSLEYIMTGVDDSSKNQKIIVEKGNGETVVFDTAVITKAIMKNIDIEKIVDDEMWIIDDVEVANTRLILKALGFKLRKINEDYYKITIPFDGSVIYANQYDISDFENATTGYAYKQIRDIAKKNRNPDLPIED